nr:RecName: Full=Phyllospetin-H4; Short=PLS-H4; AltName: Full=Phylloseptin-6; Short=PS-6 [Pithecopus hypochondrialis]
SLIPHAINAVSAIAKHF